MKKLKFTLLELLVVISIIAILATLLSPLLSTARESANRASCQNNLRSIGISIRTYTGSNAGLVPPSALSAVGHDVSTISINSGAVSSKINKGLLHIGYNAMHNANILRTPKTYRCPSRGSHDVTDDVYNANLTAKADFGHNQANAELSYPYFVNDSGSKVNSTITERATLQEGNYGSETSMARDRVINHGGYDYGNVLYGDGHVETKEIQDGGVGAASGTYAAHSWLAYHKKTALKGHSAAATTAYSASAGNRAFEGNDAGLEENGTISWYNNAIASKQMDLESSEGGGPTTAEGEAGSTQ